MKKGGQKLLGHFISYLHNISTIVIKKKVTKEIPYRVNNCMETCEIMWYQGDYLANL